MSIAQLGKRLATTLGSVEYLREYAKPMAALTLRFEGDDLAHVGKAVDAAIDRALALATAPTTFRGYLPKGKTQTRHAKPRKLDASGRKLLTTALGGVRTMPKSAIQLYVKDGDGESLVPDRFALYASLAADHGNTFSTGRGFLSIAVALDLLDDVRLVDLGDALVAALGAAVATYGPAVWLAPDCLFNSSLNEIDQPHLLIELWKTDPQVDIPSYLASRSPFGFDALEPGPLAGFLAPSWIMWATSALAKRVKKFGGEATKLRGATRYRLDADAHAMTDARYATWKARWAELAHLHLRHTSPSDLSAYYTSRFAAKTLPALGTGWSAALEARQTAAKRSDEIAQELEILARKPTAKLVAYAESVELDTAAHWHFLPGLRALVLAGVVPPAEALVWLDVAEKLAAPSLHVECAAVAVAAGDHARAIDLLRRAIAAHRVTGVSLKALAEFRPLKKDPRFVKLTAK